MRIKIRLRNSLLFLMLVSCTKFSKTKDGVVARVGATYLYRSDIEKQIKSPVSPEDSLVQAQSLINRWAYKTLLYEQALINLSESKTRSLESLVSQYRSDLFSTIYKNHVVKSRMDTVVANGEIEAFYRENQEVFKLTQPAYQIRFIQMPLNNVDITEIKRRFKRFNVQDRMFLDSLSFQFTRHFLNDTLWILKNDFIDKVSYAPSESIGARLKKSQYFEVGDSLEVYLFAIRNFLDRNEVAPLQFVYPTVRDIVLNKRKLEFLKQFDKEIIQDAVKSKKIKIY